MDGVNLNLKWIFENIKTEVDAARFYQNHRIISARKLCRKKHIMVIEQNKGNYCYWYCGKKSCKETISVRKGGWFEGSALPLKKIILFIYAWSQELTSIKFCEKELESNKESVVNFNNYLREVNTKLYYSI